MAYAGGQEFTIDGVRYRSSNITPDASGISYYNEELFIRTMRTGNVGGRRLAPIMPWADIRKLTDDDSEGAVGVPADRRARRPRGGTHAGRPEGQPGHRRPPGRGDGQVVLDNNDQRMHRQETHHENPSLHRPRPRPRARRRACWPSCSAPASSRCPTRTGTLLVYAGDTDGTAIEVWPAGTRGGVGDQRAAASRDLPLPEDWPHHGYVTTDASDADQVLAIFAREGWRARAGAQRPARRRLQPGARLDREPHRHRDRRPPDARRIRAVLRPDGRSARSEGQPPITVTGGGRCP